MKLAATIVGSLKKDMQAELRRIERAVPDGVKAAGDGLKGSLRKQVVAAGLGARLSRTWRGSVYKNKGHAFEHVVLGRLSGRQPDAGHVGGAVSAAAWADAVRNRLRHPA